MSNRPKPHLLFICFDSLNWDLIKVWAEHGLLKNFAAYLNSQNSGVIKAGKGLPTNAVWHSIYTGCKADSFTFTQPEPFWMKLSNDELKIVIIDSPKYLDVCEVNGVWISKWYSHDSPGYKPRTFPKINLSHNYDSDFGKYEYEVSDKMIDTLLASVENKTSKTLELMDNDWDFTAVFFSEPHFIGHAFWPKFFDIKTLSKSPIFTIYKKLDDAIGKIIAKCNADILIASPQGMATNTSLNMVVPRLLCEFEKANLSNAWLRTAKQTLKKEDAKTFMQFKNIFKLNKSVSILRQRNSGFASGIRINLRGRDSEGIISESDYELLLNKLEAFFYDLRDEYSKLPVVSEIIRKQISDTQMYDMLIIWNRAIRAKSIIGQFKNSIPVNFSGKRAGDHTSEGGYVYISRIKNIKLPQSIRDTDIKPIILKYFGLQELLFST